MRDAIFWQYAKIISESAGPGKKNYGFIMDRFKKLRDGDINWSSSIREYVKEREHQGRCIYCDIEDSNLTLEHMLPRSRNGPDDPSNCVWVCRSCNSSKGDKRLYEWFGLENRNSVPRVAEGKYLSSSTRLHERQNTLNENPEALCPRCDLSSKCPEEGKLTVYCLEGLFLKG